MTYRRFADQTRRYIREYGGFDPKAVAPRRDYYRYWGNAFENKFPDWDDFQIEIFGWLEDKWMERVDAQFRRVKPDFDRIVWWMQHCWGREHPKKVDEYYRLIDFPKMDNGKYYTLMATLYDNCGLVPMALNVFDKFDFPKMPEDEKERLVAFFMQRGQEEHMMRCLAKLKDRDRADYLLLTHFVRIHDHARGVPQADKVAKVPQYASYALWEKSGLLMTAGKFEEAIAVCRQVTDRGAAAPYRISDCYVRLGKIDLAVEQLRDVEKFFEGERSRACLMIANLYGSVGRPNEQVAVLREVMHKYTGSDESCRAHQALEDMHIDPEGGTDPPPD